jgi:hypothetical protein
MGIYNPFLEFFDELSGLNDAIERVKQRDNYFPKKIIKSGPCTIVFWNDGTKTMVRRAMDEETDSPYEAFTAALAIKIFG